MPAGGEKTGQGQTLVVTVSETGLSADSSLAQVRGTTARNFTSAPKASSLLSTGAVFEPRASAGRANPGPARTYLTVALIVWFGGAAIGIATLPRREGRPAGTARPPAHRPVDIESPSTHDLPNVA